MSRHQSLNAAMSALLAYKNRPEGDAVPVTTNWTVVAANDREPEVAAHMHTERRIQILPTVQEVMRQVNEGDIERNVAGQIVRIGRLKFSDGTQVEAGYKYGPGGELVGTKHRMPAGAMLGCREQESRTLGGDENPTEVSASNAYFLEMFGVKRRARASAGRKVKRTYQTHAEAKEQLAKAYANTPVLPPVTKCPPGLPNASGKIADSFIGMRKVTAGNSGAVGWQDISTAIVDREIWAQAIEALSDRDRSVLDVAAHNRMRTLTDVGIYVGQSRKYADKRSGGRKVFLAANDNLAAAIKKYSA